MTDLKSCPFCGSYAEAISHEGGHAVTCLNCHIEGEFFKERNADYSGGSRDEAIEAWNTRTPPEGMVLVPVDDFEAVTNTANDMACTLEELSDSATEPLRKECLSKAADVLNLVHRCEAMLEAAKGEG